MGSESGTVAPPPSAVSTTTGTVQPPDATSGGSTPTGTHDTVAATPSVATAVSVAIGASQTVSLTFTSSDGLAITGFAISNSLGALPAGWTGPTSFSCGQVGPGSGCVLSLTYAPVVMGSGTLTLDCVYVDNSGMPRTPGSCVSLSYAATLPNNVVATLSPTGEIDAIMGAAKQTVSVNFTTDNGNAATALAVTTNLTALPPGWSSPSSSLSCAIVSTASGCQLPLTFSPTAAALGTLTLNYSYTDDSGAARTGALNIPYATSTHDTLVATASPTGQINAVQGSGGQSVAVTFTTNDGEPASGVQLISDLTSLPPGWSSASPPFSCAVASTGNGCQLQLTYAPTALAQGTLSLRYSYDDNSGAPNFGLLNIAYAATTNDNVVGSTAPSGQINAMLGANQPVSVAFTTDDGRPATALTLTSNLGALPAGWSSSASAFSCSGLGGGLSCQLTLMYAPTALDNGTVTLAYEYINDAGEAKSGSLGIPYRTTTNDNVVASAAPLALNVASGSTNPVTVTFTTDDGNLASGLAANLNSLPMGWNSASGTFICAGVSTGTGCQLSLTYAPTAAANGTLAFGFSYTNAAGTLKTGTASIPYTATP
jgi:hypothetical protein